MAKKILKTPDGKKVVIDMTKDSCIYEAPMNPPNTGTRFTRGENLYAHKAQSGDTYFYIHEWSMWQGAVSSNRLVSKQYAEDFLIDKAGNIGDDELTDDDIKKAEQFGFNLFEETA